MEKKMITKKQMQTYLDQQARDGKTEIEAYRNLAEILGIAFEKPKEQKEE